MTYNMAAKGQITSHYISPHEKWASTAPQSKQGMMSTATAIYLWPYWSAIDCQCARVSHVVWVSSQKSTSMGIRDLNEQKVNTDRE